MALSPQQQARASRELDSATRQQLGYYGLLCGMALLAEQTGAGGLRWPTTLALLALMVGWTLLFRLVVGRRIASGKHRPRPTVIVSTAVGSAVVLLFAVLDRYSIVSLIGFVVGLVLNLSAFADARDTAATRRRAVVVAVMHLTASLLTPRIETSLTAGQMAVACVGVAAIGWAMASVSKLAQYRRRQVADLLTQARAQAAALEEANVELAAMALVDGLTGVANRRRFDELLDQHMGTPDGRPRPEELSLLLVDVDHFKAYNDHHGHQAGDDALREVAAALHAAVERHGDHVARVGGEEFAVLLPGTGAAGAAAVAAGLLGAVRGLAIPHDASPVADVLTISVGIATCPTASSCDPDDLIGRADGALYAAKAAGRDRVSASEDPAAPGRSRGPAKGTAATSTAGRAA